MLQLHGRGVPETRDMKNLKCDYRRGGLEYLMFLNQKRGGAIKGLACLDGRKQVKYMNKEETRSPRVSLEAPMLPSIIYSMEGQYVATAYNQEVFIQTDMEGTVQVHLDGVMSDMLINIDPDKCSDKAIIGEGGG